jgi:O-antigen ligase
MIFIGITFGVFIVLAVISTHHAMGFWIFFMITHGIFYQFIGKGSEHLPLVAGFVVLTIMLIRREWAGVSFGLLVLVIALISCMGISSIFGINQEVSLLTMLMYAKGYFLVLILAGAIRSDRELKIMTLYCIAGLVVGGIACIYQYLTNTFIISTIYENRAASLRGDPNDTAMLLVAGIPMIYYWFLAIRSIAAKVACVVGLGFLLAGIILTGSRGGFVALLLVMLMIFLKRPSVRIFLISVFVAAIFVVLAPSSYWERMNTMVTLKDEHQGQSLTKRGMLQRAGTSIFLQHPLLGVGPGNFGRAYFAETSQVGKTLSTMSIHVEKNFPVAHNMFLELFVENGMIGGTLFLTLFFLSVRNFLHYDRRQGDGRRGFGVGIGLALALGGMLFAGLFLSQAKNSVLWVLVGMGFAAGAVVDRKSTEKSVAIASETTDPPFRLTPA